MTILRASLTLALAAPAILAAPVAQTQSHQHATSPYAGNESREIKALSNDEIKAYREGTGMGLAMPAELNHYPGPRHVLDMAGELALTADQKASLTASFDRMHAAAIALGEQIIAREKALDQAFAAGTIDEPTLRDLTRLLGGLQAELRAVHLKAHLETKRILTPEQVAHYDAMRGYTATAH